MHHHTHLSTADIDLAATLIAAVDAELIKIDRSESGDVQFVFFSDVLETAEAYWQREIRVEPTRFSHAKLLLEGMLYERAANGKHAGAYRVGSKRGDIRLFRLAKQKSARRRPKARNGKKRSRLK